MSEEIELTNALNNKELEHFVKDCTIEEIAQVQHELSNLIYNWLGSPSKKRLNKLQKDYPYLNSFIDFEIIFERLDSLDLFESKLSDAGKFLGVHISDFFPELTEVRDYVTEKLSNHDNGIAKAKSWLKPFAVEAGANSDMEAAVYFASRENFLLEPQEIKTRWHRAICIDIERGKPVGDLSDDTIERAQSRTIPLSEASKLLEFNGSLPRFFSFRDEEENFIDATLFRSVEWFGVKGFEPWLDSFAKDMSTASQYGIDHKRMSWELFFWVRSDLAIKKSEKFGLESLLYGLINGSSDSLNPWLIFWPDKKQINKVEYTPIASSILFSWQRIEPENLDNSILDRAISLLFQTQMNSGGWPIKSNDSEGSIIATSFAIHALALSKPDGWRTAVKKAKEWLLKEQDDLGSWYVQGGPTVMLTVLALDSIALASENHDVTFQIDSKMNISLSEDFTNEPSFDYSNEKWFNLEIPRMTSISKDEALDFFNPKIALVTAVEVELKAVLKKLKPPKGKRNVRKVIDGGETYYLGRFGKFDAVVTMTGMGSQGISGSTLAIDSLIRLWDPVGIILVGIAFGASRKKHRVGDVLIANNVIPYERQRVGEEIVYRNPIAPTSHELINRIRNTLDWEFKRPDGSTVEKHIGNILSGEKLVDDPEFKEKLVTQFPQVVGGEMEGSGLWASAEKHKKSWIIIKSVCDWGDGTKHKKYQELAAASSVSLCEHTFNEKYALSGMK